MKISSLLAAVFLAAPVSGRAADPMPSAPPAQSAAQSQSRTVNEVNALASLNKAIDDLEDAWGGVNKCLAFEASLKTDLSRKEAALAAEFNGKVPLEFQDVIYKRTERIVKQHQICVQQHVDFDRQVGAVVQSFHGFELRNYRPKKQLEKVNALIAASKAMNAPKSKAKK
jgi:hypothetical protein